MKIFGAIFITLRNEVKKLKVYIDYVTDNLRDYNHPLSFSYDGISYFFIKKHLDYLQEAFSSILLKNFNAFSVLMRIIIENYVSYELIKIYKNEELYKDWYLWSYFIQIKKFDSDESKDILTKGYHDLCNSYNIPYNYIKNTQAYGWLERAVKLPRYTFKNVCELVDGEIYRDYSYFSGIIHNADIYTKTNWIDMTLLTKFLVLIVDYTDKIIKAYKPNILRRKEYKFIKNDFYAACEVCLNYTEFDKSDF